MLNFFFYPRKIIEIFKIRFFFIFFNIMIKLEQSQFAILKEIRRIYLKNVEESQKTFVRVFGNLDQIFRIANLIDDENYDITKSLFLSEIKEKLENFIDKDTFLGLLEYKGHYLLINLEKLGKDCNFIERKKYFFLGEIISINDILILDPNHFNLVEEDLDLFLYEKTVDILQNNVYRS